MISIFFLTEYSWTKMQPWSKEFHLYKWKINPFWSPFSLTILDIVEGQKINKERKRKEKKREKREIKKRKRVGLLLLTICSA